MVLCYFYIWQKPRLEALLKDHIESMSLDKSVPFKIKVKQAHFSILPLQVNLYDTHLKPKKTLKKIITPFTIKKLVYKTKTH